MHFSDTQQSDLRFINFENRGGEDNLRKSLEAILENPSDVGLIPWLAGWVEDLLEDRKARIEQYQKFQQHLTDAETEITQLERMLDFCHNNPRTQDAERIAELETETNELREKLEKADARRRGP
jgi:DNA repair exonuclease SbcCD ATPase subunit